MIDVVHRLPKMSVTRDLGSSARAVDSSDITGVMPDPAAMAT